MARTLQQLKESIETLIEQQGKDAPVAAFIFTQEDVFEMDENCNQVNFPLDDSATVLNEVEDADYIFQQVFECIDDEIRRIKIARKQKQTQ